jgi:hypothetical protein
MSFGFLALAPLLVLGVGSAHLAHVNAPPPRSPRPWSNWPGRARWAPGRFTSTRPSSHAPSIRRPMPCSRPSNRSPEPEARRRSSG